MKYLSTLTISEIPIYAFSQTASVIRYRGAEQKQFGKANRLSGSFKAMVNPFVVSTFSVNNPQPNVQIDSQVQAESDYY